MADIVGEYYCKLDSKGRLMIPSGLKKQLPPEANDEFVANRGFERCISLYPNNEWSRVSSRVKKLNGFNLKNREFQRYFFAGATRLSMDGSHRILLPRQLLKYAGITRELVLFAYSDYIEIWDKDTYERLLSDEPEDFARLAEQVMGDNDNKTYGDE